MIFMHAIDEAIDWDAWKEEVFTFIIQKKMMKSQSESYHLKF